MGNKFGWHSGVLTCKDAKIQGDLYVQDDIVFSDVSAGVLGVTGGIDMTGTTSAIGISLTSGSFTTGAIMCGTGTSARQTMAEAEDFVIGIYTTCADTDGANTAKPLYVNAQYSGAGQVARAAEFVLYPTAKLGGWANALKGYTDFSGDSDGGSTGLASAICAEMKLPNGACNGAFYPMEVEWVGQASTAFGAPGTGTQSGFIYLAASGTVTDFDSDGVFMSINGLTGNTGKLLSANSQTLKVDIGNGTATRYLIMSESENVLSLTGADVFTFTTSGGKISAAASSSSLYGGGTTGDALVLQGSSVDATQKITITGNSGTTLGGTLGMSDTLTITDATTGILLNFTASKTEGLSITTATSMTLTTGMSISGAGTTTTGILIDATACTTGISITAGSLTDGIKISGTTPVDGIEISSACSANGINLSGSNLVGITIGTCTNYGILMEGTYTNAIRITTNVGTTANAGVRVLNTYTATTGYHTAVMGASIVDPTGGTGYGAAIGVYGEANIKGTFTGGINWSFGVRGTLQLNANTVINNASSIFGAINASMKDDGTPTFTAGHICGIYIENLIDANIASTSGIATMLYMANNSNATCTLDSAIYLYGPKVTYFAQLTNCTVAGCVAVAAVGGSQTHKIKIDIDGVDFYIPCHTA